MKKLILFAMLFIFLTVIPGYSGLAQEPPIGPKMVLKEQVFDFGKVRQGQVIKHAFAVLNTGDQPLKIVRVKPG